MRIRNSTLKTTEIWYAIVVHQIWVKFIGIVGCVVKAPKIDTQYAVYMILNY